MEVFRGGREDARVLYKAVKRAPDLEIDQRQVKKNGSAHDRRLTGALSNTRFNVQSRAILETLQPSGRWVLNVGFRATCQFRRVAASAIATGSTLVAQFDSDALWAPGFVNMAGVSVGARALLPSALLKEPADAKPNRDAPTSPIAPTARWQ